MSHDDDDLTREEHDVRDALRRLPPVAADPRFRERLRREFRSERFAPRGRTSWKSWALAASVLVMLGGSAVLANRGAQWTVVGASGSGVVRIDGRAIDVGDGARLAEALVPGVLLTTDAQTELQLSSGEMLALVVTADTTMRLPGVPGRWFGRSIHASLERGELRGRTGRRFAGARLHIALPDATVEITGTTFAVLRNEEGSCVCVLEGAVSMQDQSGAFVVEPSHRRVVPPGGAASRDEAIRPIEAMKLEMLRDQTRARWASAPD